MSALALSPAQAAVLRRRVAAISDQRGRRVSPFPDWLYEVDPSWQWDAPHLAYVREHLERVTSGETTRLIITMPPRHGKTEHTTIRYAAWRMERDPGLRVIITSYNQHLATEFSRKVRRIVRDRIGLASDRAAAGAWDSATGSSLRAAGVGSGVTGLGANLIIIDDPIKSRLEADSARVRDSTWNWFTDDLYTRLEPDGAIVLIQCMTGDTPVLMATGEEVPLRNVRIGDQIATYDNGKIATSTVRNWANQGPDRVFEIRMKSGIIVKANARHPFLVEEDGELKWQRTATLKKGSVILKVTGGSGKESHALQTAVTSQPNAKACARPTTASIGGRLDSVRLRPTLHRAVRHVCDIGTELAEQSMMRSWHNKVVSALSVNNLPLRGTLAPIGTGNSASTTAMKPGGYADCSAMTAISLSDMASPQRFFPQPPSTYAVTRDEVVSVTASGVEDVFDIQVDRTENFIANGLVSHNTRWHEDDLAGRILASDDGPKWEVVHLPALAVSEDDALGRPIGAALWPERFNEDELEAIRQATADRTWWSLYQGMPQPDGGSIYLREWWQGRNRYRTDDRRLLNSTVARIISWDTAESTGDDAAYSAAAVMDVVPWDRGYAVALREVWRGRVAFADLLQAVESLARRWNQDEKLRHVIIENASSGRAGVQMLRLQSPSWLAPLIQPFPVHQSKDERARVASVPMRNGRFWLPEPSESTPWLFDFEDELYAVPSGRFRDQTDATAQGVIFLQNYLREPGDVGIEAA